MSLPGRLRFAAGSDAEGILTIYGPIVRTSPASFQLEPPSIEAMTAKIEATMRMHPWLVYEEEGRILGYAYAMRHRERVAYQWAAETSVYVHPEAQRRGVGRALYTALLRVLAQQNYCRAFAGITLPNKGSVGLHERMGFTHLGTFENTGYKFGQWHDVGWWAIDIVPLPQMPTAPLPLANVRAQTLCEDIFRSSLMI